MRLADHLGGVQYFDEYAAGYGDASLLGLFGSAPYRWALLQLAFVLCLALWSLGKRRLPAQRATGPIRRRRVVDHIAAIAGIWQNTRDAGLPLAIVLQQMSYRARKRLGHGAVDNGFVAGIRSARPELAKEAAQSYREAQVLADTLRPHKGHVLNSVRKLRRLEQQALQRYDKDRGLEDGTEQPG